MIKTTKMLAEETGLRLAETKVSYILEMRLQVTASLPCTLWCGRRHRQSHYLLGSIASTHTSPVKTATAGFHLAPERPLV